MTLYKALDRNGCGPYSGFDWPKPVKNQDGSWTPGEWVEAEGELEMCFNGIHYCNGEEQLLSWINARLYEIEISGDSYCEGGKCVARRGRLVRRLETWGKGTARLFACDCAEHVLHLYENQYPDDDRPRVAIETARRYATGKATRRELAAARAAAWDAARAAAWDAAWDADWDAERLRYYLEGGE